jgi:hypothetical protein
MPSLYKVFQQKLGKPLVWNQSENKTYCKTYGILRSSLFWDVLQCKFVTNYQRTMPSISEERKSQLGFKFYFEDGESTR